MTDAVQNIPCPHGKGQPPANPSVPGYQKGVHYTDKAHGWNPHCNHYGVLYPAPYHPHAPHALYHLHPVFREGSLWDSDGKCVSWEALKGMSVALYFGAGNIRRCRNFTPFLTHYYKTINEASDRQKLEVVYVPLDETEEEYKAHTHQMPWLKLKLDEGLIADFKQHFAVFSLPERPRFGVGPRMQPPHLVVVGSDGRTLKDLPLDQNEPKMLTRWNYENCSF